jgi:hypothetical protein
VNVIKTFRRVAGLTTMTAIHEAMSLVTSDGLYEHDVVSVPEGTNRLSLDLKHTFALDNQASGEHICDPNSVHRVDTRLALVFSTRIHADRFGGAAGHRRM